MTDVTLNSAYLPTHFYEDGELVVSEEVAIAFQENVESRLETMDEAQQELFLRLLSIPLFTSFIGENLSVADEVLSRLEIAAARLGSFDSSVTPEQLARVLMDLIQECVAVMRQNELEGRLLAREITYNKMMGAANESEDAAKELSSSAGVSLGLALGGAALSLMFSAVSMWQTTKSAKTAAESTIKSVSQQGLKDQANIAEAAGDTKEFTKLTDEMAQIEVDVKALDKEAGRQLTWGQAWAGIGSTINAVGQSTAGFVTSDEQASAKLSDAEASKMSAEAENKRKQEDQASQLQSTLEELVKQLIAAVYKMQDIENTTMQNMKLTG